jgi:UDP-2,3-diacylglucosamine hydrolase
MAVLFIADLHLDPARPALTRLLLEFFAGDARRGDSLYILGDLFEAWVGDDDDAPLAAAVTAALRRLVAGGVPVQVQHGNRDFLIGEGFAAATGCSLLPEHVVIHLDGVPTLLMHGDLLCTGDTEYLAFRARVTRPEWKAAMLGRSLAERRAIAANLRAESQAATTAKDYAAMDAAPDAVLAALREHGARRLIHGHTHRPGIHPLPEIAPDAERIVLGDWRDDRGSVLVCDADGCRLRDVVSGGRIV